MRTFHNDLIFVRPSFFIVLTFAVLSVPLKWFIGWFLAVVIHECAHYLALYICNVRVFQITLSLGGAKMHTETPSLMKEAICAAAGPIGSFALLLTLRCFPYIAVCALVQGIFNLLPIYPLDGGRIIRCVLIALFGDMIGKRVSNIIGNLCLLISFAVTAFVTFQFSLGILPIVIVVILLIKTRRWEKLLANQVN